MSDRLYRLWDLGQHHLAAGRYIPATLRLAAAERIAWRLADPATLARIHLPLLEAHRLIRQQAVEGAILISDHPSRAQIATFLQAGAGTLLCAQPALLRAVMHAARRTGRCFEGLLILRRGDSARLAAPADPRYAAGLPIRWNSAAAIAESTDPALVVPLPPPGSYPAHAIARESLLIAWEALALRWQARHPLPRGRPSPHAAWTELAWLRTALRIDPACEPVAMRLIALAEQIARN